MPEGWRTVDGEDGALRVYAAGARVARPLVLFCHDLPREANGAADVARAYPPMADRLAEACGCRVVAPMLRGAGGSDGDFSATGWLADLARVMELEDAAASDPWLVGFGVGGALALRAAVRDAGVRGVVSVAAPADFTAWAGNVGRLLELCRRSGVVRTEGFPKDVEAWVAELVALAPLDAAAHLEGRPLLVVHGSDDAEAPTAAARALADAAAGGHVDLRIVPAAGHLLMADPRMFATLLGWIERHR